MKNFKDLREQFNAVDFAEYEPKAFASHLLLWEYDEDKYNKIKTQLIVSFEVQELAKDHDIKM